MAFECNACKIKRFSFANAQSRRVLKGDKGFVSQHGVVDVFNLSLRFGDPRPADPENRVLNGRPPKINSLRDVKPPVVYLHRLPKRSALRTRGPKPNARRPPTVVLAQKPRGAGPDWNLAAVRR
eukprot:11180944-Lingulodinium_polyedra.AAC.1